jgi:hypothetical protein
VSLRCKIDKRKVTELLRAVLGACNNFANQDVFRMARAADPAGVRTVGIVTKCDAVQKGDEPGVSRFHAS